MGTNYYWVANACTHCGRGEEVHIGKSSVGWKFLFHGGDLYEIGDVCSFQEWKKVFKGCGYIKDEYEDCVSVKEFVEMVEKKQSSGEHEDPCAGGCLSMRYWTDKDGYDFSSMDFC